MENNMKTKVIVANSPEELRSLLEETISNSFSPTLAIVFASVHHETESFLPISYTLISILMFSAQAQMAKLLIRRYAVQRLSLC